MKLADLKSDLDDEVSTILAADFSVEVTTTTVVPHSSDPKITFPNLDAKTLKAKLIDTCVLYIDIRRSTELNLAHKPQTVAKLYSAFVRTMTRCAQHYKGQVRGIIGDRVMVLFDCDNAFVNAVNCAVLMNSAATYVINKHFKKGEVTCGIGIDAGRMLATKTGIRKQGQDQQNYRALVWLGRPANVASKLTDLANKPAESVTLPSVRVAYGIVAPMPTSQWIWQDEWPHEFVQNIEPTAYPLHGIRHKNPKYASHFFQQKSVVTREKTPPILMAEVVWDGFRAAAPGDKIVQGGWIKKVDVNVPGYSGAVYGGDVIFTLFRPDE